MIAVNAGVEVAQEGDGLEVLTPAEFVRYPLAGLPAVVEVKHRGHRIDPEAVSVIAFKPKQRVRFQKIRDLTPPVVVDERAPVLVKPKTRVRVLIERRAIEPRQAVGIGREVCRHPVEQDADACLVKSIDEPRKIVRRAEPPCWSEEPDRLIAPGAGEGMLADGQELDVREAQ